ncbi:carboxymuconolactone decarboxylase family protein [Novosphingobium panipatense]|uniref:carboxymuconolactone decarboxylase family protein n=1 Tax=Novosphingobium TaxID=165696 RepID=UPI000CDA4420|nr:carboxymuconolactone decarboxylase family protein [Novosphingobium sp. HII-3]
MAWDPTARERQILGAAERLSPVGADALDERHFQAMEQLRLLYGHPETVPLASFFANLAHSPEFFAAYIQLGVTISMHSALPRRLRELAILRTAWLTGAPYAWGEHVHATQGGLLSEQDIAAIIEGSPSMAWGDLERAVLQAVEELHADALIGDATWSVLAGHLEERQLVELLILIGHYVTTAYLQNSLRTALTAHGRGLSAR